MNKYIILMQNLLSRFEYNKKQALYALRGSITIDEREALRRAMEAFESQEASK